jgi:hypothetical protein
MPLKPLLAVLSFVVAMSAACTFGPQFETEKAGTLVDESNKLNSDANALINDAVGAYSTIYDKAQKADDPFEELGAQGDAFKKLEPQIDTAKGKLRDASQKLGEAASLKLPDWYKQYLTSLSDLNKSGSESADLILQMVRNTYDPNIQSPEDLDAKQNALKQKLDAENKRRTELNAALTKIADEHKDEFVKK